MERVAGVNRRYETLRIVLERTRESQDYALGRRHRTEIQELEQLEAIFGATASLENDLASEREQIIMTTNRQLQHFQEAHAIVLVDMVGRHRRDQDHFMLNANEAALVDLMEVQNLERSALKRMQEVEMWKWRNRGAFKLRLFEEDAKERRKFRSEEMKGLKFQAMKIRRQHFADCKWFDTVWEDRRQMLEEDRERMIQSGADTPADDTRHQQA